MARVQAHGFTLLEMIVVLGVAGVCLSLALFIPSNTVTTDAWYEERDVVRAVLLHARSRALTRICSAPTCETLHDHGVYFGEEGVYTVFEGPSYAERFSSRDERNERPTSFVRITGCREVVFAAGSGMAQCAPSSPIELRYEQQRASLVVESSGRITWNE